MACSCAPPPKGRPAASEFSGSRLARDQQSEARCLYRLRRLFRRAAGYREGKRPLCPRLDFVPLPDPSDGEMRCGWREVWPVEPPTDRPVTLAEPLRDLCYSNHVYHLSTISQQANRDAPPDKTVTLTGHTLAPTITAVTQTGGGSMSRKIDTRVTR